MKNNRLFQTLIILLSMSFSGAVFSASSLLQPCTGKFPNPVTDICWTCLFPIKVGAFTLSTPNQRDNGDLPPPLLCACPAPPPIFIRVGVGVSFWEPARMAEVVRTPMCSPTLGGTRLGILPVPAGTHSQEVGKESSSFYHVHWFSYPVMSWLGMGFTAAACSETETFDMLYMSELDPLWDSDESSFLLNPEAVLFTNPIAQASCAADSIKAGIMGFGFDAMFWCAGSQGSVYPFTGSNAMHTGGVDASLNLVHRFIFKMHRELLGRDTSTVVAMCGSIPQPLLRKNQYKEQMVFPISHIPSGLGLGAPSTIWGAGREFPYKGEDYGYLIWRKRQCCAF